MNKKIKVIELFNRVYNKENLPKRVKYKGEIFKLARWDNEMFYHNKEGSMIKKVLHFCNLEDEEEIDIQGIEEMEYLEDYEADKTDIRLNRDKINEILRAVKRLDKKINKED